MHNPLNAANKIVAHVVRHEPYGYREVAEVLPWADPYILSLITMSRTSCSKAVANPIDKLESLMCFMLCLVEDDLLGWHHAA